ncbi:kinetochore protein [Arabidopsis lyrata subsp. lyrata]|uniref:Kinetochore protein NDC80 n=1 Tax=Arabidopsis lyrata subsp. lyrata TaxID=81972 RepID=D7LUW1_ARALL|nr:kinetochore protein NDC80 homolog [Arabidopsis lyrata subsp. lyrata]EFH54250.1 kinetochore protein [Arabidopsis lyrata subsp. lyrata]|eukprot:XP_020881311.1 kinetochore protein NDC80 homolog [Arabidopsis lyrata subsp. lyrata]
MRGGATGKRRTTVGFGGAPPPPPPSIEQQRHLFNSRDSDASFASSRPSSIGLGGRASDDRSSMIRFINAFLSSHNSLISIRANPVPSVKDISETLKFILSKLDYPCDSIKWDEDLVFFLKSQKCPFKITKSSLKAPNTPHNWPTVLAVVHWLVELARFHQHLSSNSTSEPEANSMNFFAIQSFSHFIRGEDDKVNELDSEFLGKLEAEKTSVAETISGCEKISGELEAKLESLRKGPSKKESLEKAKADLENDVNKFRTIIAEYTEKNPALEKVVEEKDKELKAKEEERERISKENKELKKSVELQNFSARDVERMRRELQAVERDVAEAEVARDGWDLKAWELNSQIGNQFHQIQTLSIDCNQALRRLKIDIQFTVNERGKTPAKVMGVDYKSVVKPALCSLYDGIKGSLNEKMEELVTLQHQVSEMASKIESTKSLLGSIQLQINELEEKMKLVKKETQDLTTKCDLEAKTLVESVKTEALNLEVVEKEAAEFLKASEVRLQEAEKQSEEEVQACAAQLFALIDSISKQKEYMDLKILEIKTGVADTASAVSEIYKANFKKHLGI